MAIGTEQHQQVDADEARVDELVDGLLADVAPDRAGPAEFWGAQFDRGLAWVHFPEGLGGLGLAPGLQRRIQARLARAGGPVTPSRAIIGHGMVAPTVLTHGTPAQQDRYLRPLFTCEEIWCQLFSEPGAGSDVSGLATRAERDGDEWRVNGQKVWTTVAHLAHFGLLLARTDPELPKHQGMTMFLVDMTQDEVDVRPLFQITGEAEFNEVFFTDARIPDEAGRLGGVGEGWRVALTTLMNERVSIGGGVPRRGQGAIGDALRLWKERWASVDTAQARVLRDRVLSLFVRAEVTRLTNARAAALRRVGTPGPEGSVGKLSFAEQNQLIYELCVDLMGAEGMLHSSDYPKVRPGEVAIGTTDLHKAFLRARANSIEGGTSEVMRNIMGERVLGLPGDPRGDKGIPWKDVPRS